MKDFLTNILLDFSEESEKKMSYILIRFLYYLNCIIISIWIANIFGFNINSFDISPKSIVKHFSDLSIIVPIFILMFVVIASKTITRFIAVTISLIVQLMLYLIIYRKKKSKYFFLYKRNIIDKELNKGLEFDTFINKLNQRKSVIKESKLEISYYIFLFLTVWFIYNQIVSEKFSILYYSWINATITILVLFFLIIIGLVYYVEDRDKSDEKKLKSLGLFKEK